METGAITSYVDVAQLVLYAFWIFFAGLIYYLVREGHREGYPMVTESGRGVITGWPMPKPKTYLLPHGGTTTAPPQSVDRSMDPNLALTPSSGFEGAALLPTGTNPMLDGVGPGAWVNRADVPDLTREGDPKITPLRITPEYEVSENDPDPRGMKVYGFDGEVGGTVTDLWVDKSEAVFRFLEVRTPAGRQVMLPLNFLRMKRDLVQVKSIKGAHFEDVPGLKSPDQITFLEEEKIYGYFGAGTLYADPSRTEPLV
jgi:photosynthetic reaction center H subunit